MDCSLLFWLPVGHLIKNGTLDTIQILDIHLEKDDGIS